jgi:hypothetical protein
VIKAGLALLSLALALSPSPPPVPLVRYEMVESLHAMTPRGERDSAVKGTVTVAGDRARWDLAAGTFPRSHVTGALVARGRFTLLDIKEGVSADATRDDFDSLFLPKAGEPAAAAPVVRDLVAIVRTDGAGRTFEGLPTTRWRVEVKWTLSVSLPGTVNTIRHTTRGTIETADVPEARSPFDAMARLFTARGEAREALLSELGKVTGFPVFVALDSTAEPSTEVLSSGSAPGADRPAASATTTTTTTVKRVVSKLTRGKLRPEDEAVFAVPPGFKSRGLERLLLEEPSLR